MSKNSNKRINQLEYFWIIRSLIYIMKYTRFGIIYSVSKLSRFISNPSLDHWKTIKRYSNIWGVHELWAI